jgi:hypothetical protein
VCKDKGIEVQENTDVGYWIPDTGYWIPDNPQNFNDFYMISPDPASGIRYLLLIAHCPLPVIFAACQ